jgi:hypothetical protein
MREVRLDDNETCISGARLADCHRFGARGHCVKSIGIAKIRQKRQSQPQQGRHPVDVGWNHLPVKKPSTQPSRSCYR